MAGEISPFDLSSHITPVTSRVQPYGGRLPVIGTKPTFSLAQDSRCIGWTTFFVRMGRNSSSNSGIQRYSSRTTHSLDRIHNRQHGDLDKTQAGTNTDNSESGQEY